MVEVADYTSAVTALCSFNFRVRCPPQGITYQRNFTLHFHAQMAPANPIIRL